MNTISNGSMGLVDRVKTAAGVMLSGKLPNPLAEEPKVRSRGALVKELNEWCLSTRKFWGPLFKRIEEEQEFAAGFQWPEDYVCQGGDEEPYIADRIQQMLNRNTASTYAKNPTPEAKQVERMLFEVWDGSQESLNGARAILEAAQPILQAAQAARVTGQEIPPPPPEIQEALDIVQDYELGMAEKALKAKLAKTASLLIAQQWRVQSPEFLASMKQLVTQIFTARVGYVKVQYRRGTDDTSPPAPLPAGSASGNQGGDGGQAVVAERANLPVDQIASLQQRLQAMLEPDFDPDSAEAEETRLLMESLARKQEAPTPAPLQGGEMGTGAMEDGDDNEGVVYDFLGPTSVLVDRNCKCLREFVGARRIAHEMVMEVEQVEQDYGVSLRDAGAVPYTEDGPTEKAESGASRTGDQSESENSRGKVCVWVIEDKGTGLCYVVCDGVPNFLREPYEMEPAVNRFWSIVPLMFNVQSVRKNDPKKDVTIYPRSHVRLAMPMQRSINQAGESLKEHRVGARPWNIGVKSKFADEDWKKLAGPREAHDCILLDGLHENEKISDFIQPGPTPEFHPELYTTSPDDQAMMLATGAQPANLGAQNPDETATGQSIAEGSRITVDNSNSGELDFGLSTLAQMTFEMLLHMPAEKVKARVGRGAVWPELTREEVLNEVFLQIEAGSSGRPNQAVEVSNFKILGPLIEQMLSSSGKSLEPLIKEGVRRLNDKADVEDYLKPAQVVAPTQQIAPVGPGGQRAEGGGQMGLPPGASAPNLPQPGQAAPGAVAPPLPPVSRNQVAATVNGG